MTVAASTIARHAVTMAWSINRGIPNFYKQQIQGVWSQTHEWLPHPSKSMILGMGSIGLSIAKLLDADGIEVIGVKQTAITSIPPHFSKVCYGDSWLDELPFIDWIFLALPKTNQTVNLIDREVLCRLPDHAILVNVGRGETLVTKDLCEYLNKGKLGGAALDVVFPKPTEPNDIFWSTSRLIITPHVASHCKERSTGIEIFCEQQLSKFISKLLPENIVKWDF
jgi:phosphoglycerate dehydrogenase-like enzyme